MEKNNFFLTAIILITIFILSGIFILSNNNTNSKNIDFLKCYGWEVEKNPTEKVEFLIPEVFDEVYLNYNELQSEAGLDLVPYKGFFAVRYTYVVKNFPQQIQEPVFANVICVDGIPVAGDICTVSINGFMYSLNFNTQNCYSNNLMKNITKNYN